MILPYRHTLTKNIFKIICNHDEHFCLPTWRMDMKEGHVTQWLHDRGLYDSLLDMLWCHVIQCEVLL